MEKFYKYTALNDYLFKYLMSNKEVLSYLINLISGIKLDEFYYHSQEIVNHERGKLTRMDVRIRSKKYDIAVEMQRRIDETYENTLMRARTYYARLESNSIDKGMDYYEARKCYLFIFINERFNEHKVIETLSLNNNVTNKEIRDEYIYIIDLTKAEECDNIVLKKWLMMLKSNYPDEYKGESKIMDTAINLIKQCNNESYDELETAELFYTEQRNRALLAVKKAKKDGIEIGELKKLKEFATSLYEITKDLDLVSQATKMSIKDLKLLLGL